MCLAAMLPSVQAQPSDSLLTALLSNPVSVAESEVALARTRTSHVTVLTAEDLEAFGFTTLAEAVQQLAGIYVAYDHAYAYLGVRGLGLTSDYNSRLTVAIDGVSTREFVFGSSLTERGLGIPLSAIERIEVLRGPGTLEYGSGAMVMVIHIVTRTSARLPRLGAQVLADAYRAFDGNVSYTRKTERDDLVLMGQGFRAPGRTYRFNHDEVGPYTSNFDLEEAYGFFARYQREGTVLSMMHSRRHKDVPTAPFETRTDAPTIQRDQTTQVRLRHTRPLRESLHLTADASAHWYGFSGDYPYATDEGLHYQTKDFGEAARYTLSAETRYATAEGNTWTLSSSFVHHPALRYRIEDRVNGNENGRSSMSVASTALSGEWQLAPRVMARAGGQIEWNSFASNTRFAPEAGLVYSAADQATFRVFYAHTYRLPSFYETLQADAATRLVAESGNALELTASIALSPTLHLDVGAYVSRFNNLIRARLDDSGMDAYENNTDVELRGVEVSLHRRVSHRSYVYANYAFNAPRVSRGLALPNSPRHLARAGGWSRWGPWLASTHWRLEGPRSTLRNLETQAYLVGDFKASLTLSTQLTLNATLFNVLNATYDHPGGHDHLMNSIPQAGRSAGLGLTLQVR